ncbi:MAG: alkaline phosphatase family protein [Gemmatimonadota bacterium]|nr:alkaline phosphatase family protein [Gemmatimonadota bacterium]
MSHKRHPLVLIGLDAAEIERIDQFVAEGRMPTLARLRQVGHRGHLSARPAAFLSMVWPTFYSAQPMGHHAWYYNKLWRPERSRLDYVSPSWLPIRNFVSDLPPDLRVAVLDLPFAADAPVGLNGVYLNGWQCHDDFGKQEWPVGLRAELEKRHGKAKLAPEVFGPQSVRTLMQLRSMVQASDRQFGEVCRDLLGREPWDLFLAVFGSTHRGSHYLWDLSQVDLDGAPAEKVEALEGALADCYASADAALGRVLEVAGDEARVVVFALHGMGPNLGWFEYLPRLLDQIHRGGGAAESKRGLLYRIKKALPWTLVRQVTRRIPHAWNQALVPIWSRRMYDWGSTRYFSLPTDHNGYIRINLEGREPNGIVRTSELPAVYEEIRAGLLSYRDLKTGQPVVADVIRTDDVVGPDAPRRDQLPDMVVIWQDRVSVAEVDGVTSERYGEVRWEAGGRFPSGRSGNHTHHGWFVATGPGLAAGESDEVYDIADLVPTALQWLGAALPEDFVGQPIPELVEGGGASTSG